MMKNMIRQIPRSLLLALMILAMTLATLPGQTGAKYVKQTASAEYTLSVIPLTTEYILKPGYTFSTVLNDNASDIEILYFMTQTRTSYTEGTGGATHTDFKAGSYWNWENGIDVGLTNDTIRFFYDADTKTGYVIGKGSHIIQGNSDTTYMYYGLSSLKEVYYLDYNGDMALQEEPIVTT